MRLLGKKGTRFIIFSKKRRKKRVLSFIIRGREYSIGRRGGKTLSLRKQKKEKSEAKERGEHHEGSNKSCDAKIRLFNRICGGGKEKGEGTNWHGLRKRQEACTS